MARQLYIREWREYHGLRASGRKLSQARLGERVELSGAQISRLERGVSDYSGKVLRAIADALNCEDTDLYHPPPEDETELQFRRRVAQMNPPAMRRAERILAALDEEAPALANSPINGPTTSSSSFLRPSAIDPHDPTRVLDPRHGLGQRLVLEHA